MDLDKWINTFEEALSFVGKPYTNIDKDFLLKEYSKEDSSDLMDDALELVDTYLRFFFHKATIGDIFGPLNVVELEFGQSIESRYGFSKGPFIDLAKCYWTFRFEIDKIEKKYWNLFFFQILRNVETKIAGIFFPAPGQDSISTQDVRHTQFKILQEYAPQININKFFAQIPKTKKSGCLGSISLASVIMLLLIFILFIY